jgi:hypothetical protein
VRSGDLPGFPKDDDESSWLLFQQDGVISRAQAMRFITDGVLRRRVASGRWLMASGLRGFDEMTVHVYLPTRLRVFSVPSYVNRASDQRCSTG